jgi:hypothetical protein
MASEGEIIRVNLLYSASGASQAMNVFHWEVSDTFTDAAIRTALMGFVDAWATDWADLADDDASLDEAQFIVLSSTGAVLRTLAPYMVAMPGDSLGGETTPAAVSGFMQAASLLAGIYGRKYVPFIQESLIGQGILNASPVTTLIGMAIDWLLPIEISFDIALRAGVLSTKTGGFVRLQSPASISDVPGYQRRRKPNVGS